MGQQQSSVSFSLGTKLLISVVSLLFIAIGFLDVSTIVLLEKDKRAYTYQAQSTEAVLVGREFVGLAKNALDSLRLSLASLDPLKPVTAQQNAALKSVLENQSLMISVALLWVNPQTGASQPIVQIFKDDQLSKLQFSKDELTISQEYLKETAPELLQNAFGFFNLSRVGRHPLIAVAMVDVKLKGSSAGFPVAIGFVPFQGFGEVKSSNLKIVNREGWVLFDSDPTQFYGKKNIADDPLFDAALANPTASGAQEYDHEGRHYLGSYVKPGFDLMVLNKTDWRTAMRATYALTEKFILLGLMAIGAAIVFAILFAKTLTAPLNRLYEATKEVAAGNFDVQLKARSRDEIGALSTSFNAMSSKINGLIAESMQKVHLENELAIASTVQQTLIPPASFRNQNVDIQSHYQAATQCGGDWWGFFGVGGKICIMISDATGHGLPSALITASARSCFSVMHKLAQEDPEFGFSPGAMLSYANRVVHDAANGKIMMTFFIAVLDLEQRTLSYSSAGHNPPWLFSKKGDSYTAKSLKSMGPRLGEERDVTAFEEKTLPVSEEDVLFLYTDGLLEGTNAAGEVFGKRKAQKIVESHLNAGPESVIKAVISDFLAHNGKKELDDDVTLAAAKIVSFNPPSITT